MSAEEYLRYWFLKAHHPKDKSDKEFVSISWGACEEIMESYAREYHAKEMEMKLKNIHEPMSLTAKELGITKGEWRKHQRKELAELRPVREVDIEWYNAKNVPERWEMRLSVSKADRDNGSPKIGDMIARNPKNHNDQWLVNEQYYKDNFSDPIDFDPSELLERYNEAIEVLKLAKKEINNDLNVTPRTNLMEKIEQTISKSKQ